MGSWIKRSRNLSPSSYIFGWSLASEIYTIEYRARKVVGSTRDVQYFINRCALVPTIALSGLRNELGYQRGVIGGGGTGGADFGSEGVDAAPESNLVTGERAGGGKGI